MPIFTIWNGPMPTAAAQQSVTTGNVIKTMLQIKPSATLIAKVVGWSVSMDAAAAAAGPKWELVETDAAATVTACVANDIVKVDADALMCGDPTTNLIQVGTAATGYTASAEGSITVTRVLDVQMIQPTNQFVMRFELDNYPVIQVAKFLRVRVTAAAAVNAVCGVTIKI